MAISHHLRNAAVPHAITTALARSWLIRSALSDEPFLGPTDRLVIDLEDSILPTQKLSARESLRGFLSDGRTAWVRVNDARSGFWASDLEVIRSVSGVKGIVLSKTESAHQVAETRRRLACALPIVALVETARGIEKAAEIASARGVTRIAFGSGDYRRDTGAADDTLAMAYPRSRLVVASRLAGLPGPIDGPSISTDVEALSESCRQAALLGMTGKLHLDASQSGQINSAFSPSRAELEEARAILREHGPSIQDASSPARAAGAAALILRTIGLGVVGADWAAE
ncbi:CoA ester lyase [soil metagenome]